MKRRPGETRYAFRNRQAKREGYGSYWNKRQIQRQAKGYQNLERDEFIRRAKQPRHRNSAWRARWAAQDRKNRQQPYDRTSADREARRLGVGTSSQGPPSRIFWYHSAESR